MRDARGPEIDGHIYVEHLGEGGYSDVFLYERRSPRMKVAVKVLKDVRLTDAELRQFAAEAETMAELADHPYIVQVFSADTTADGRPYLVMKFYPGANLAKRSATARMSVADVLRTGVKITSAVETAHRAGILHRDIKPANVLVSPYGEPGLTDFGIAGRAADTENDDDLGVSIPWSPPEVLVGTSNGSVRSDVYSLAATVWHLLVGRSPFEIPHGDNTPRAITQRVLNNTPPGTGRADVPASLDRLLQHALAKRPEARPRTALEFAQALQSIEQEQRFDRTVIVVPGVDEAPLPASPRTDDEPDRTRLKAPQRVAGQRPRGPSAFAPPPATQTPDATAARATRNVISQVPHTAAGPQAPAPSQPRARKGPAELDAPATMLRPQRPVVDETPPAPAKGLRPKHAAVIAVGVGVAAAVVGSVLAFGGSDPSTPEPTPSNTSTGQNIGNTTLRPPDIAARYDAAAHVVRFTWKATNPDQHVTYRYWLGDDRANERTASPGKQITVRSSKPADTCITMLAKDADGYYSDLRKLCGS